MEPSRHVVRDVNWCFERCSYDPRDPLFSITGKFRSFFVGAGACWWTEDAGDNERVVSDSETNRSYSAEDGGDGSCQGVGGALVVEIFGRFVSGNVRSLNMS